MNIEKISEKIIDEGSTEIIIKTDSKDLILLGYILEAFEGFCNYTTINRNQMLVKIITTKHFTDDVKKILNFLQKFKP